MDITNKALKVKLKLNIDSWGIYKKGDEDIFNIPLHDEKNGLTRFSIDKRWDIISIELIQN